MTSRERTMVVALVAVASLAVALVGASLWWDDWNRLQTEHQRQRLAASRLQTQVLETSPPDTEARQHWATRFWPAGTSPALLDFTAQVRRVAQRAGLPLDNLRVVEQGKGLGWIQLQTSGTIDRWFAFLSALTAEDSRVLFRQTTMKVAENGSYSFQSEVGYASLP